jgi:ArsR family transcriptional regulator, nickel/cobalt-responsive transcriptional repressor
MSAPPPPTSDELERATRLFACLAHPMRLSVLDVLHREGPRCVTELLAEVGGEQSALSHQLRTLRDNRLVAADREGRRMLYRLHDTHVASLVGDALAHIREHD